MNNIRKPMINFGFMSWPGIALTISIIAIRAFQPGAAQMSDWSWWSWGLMLIPAFFSFLVWILFTFFWLVAIIFFSKQ